MTAFTYSSPGVASYGSPPSIDTYTKSFDSTASNRIGELQKFLLGSDWSSLSSLSPPTAPIHASVDESSSVWPSTTMSDAPLFPSSAETVRPVTQSTAVATPAPAFDASLSGTSAAPVADAAAHQPESLTPPHRQSLYTCYSDSVGSPDSERDFLTSPSMFDDADFEFDADTLANNFPLFGEHSYEDISDAHADDSVNAFASNFENVKLECAEDFESQQTKMDLGASQATVMPSQSQVKTEDDTYDSPSTLEAAFKTEADSTKLEPKYEHDLWSANELQPYFDDDDTKAAVLSTLANAFGSSFSDPVKHVTPTTPASDSIHCKDDHHQHTSQVGPIRGSRANRERRSSPTKVPTAPSTSASPAPFVDPVTKVKSWQCTECGKWFDRAYNLKTHRYTHENPETRARPFVCPEVECQKQFARKHDMQRHFENVHRGESRRAKTGPNKRSRADDLG
ncbi:hypothetical protein NDA16_001816 [Ustilago loliicola]|nr:hypothetical protein NDA16_001816 [Ustilago loliicola]